MFVGQHIGNYRVIRKLGEGGMGSVFEAVHTNIGRRAAIKVLKPELSQNPEMASRFFNEARAVNIIQHPGIVGIFEFGQLPEGAAYFVMEYLEGEPLSRFCQGTSPSEVLRLGRQLASTLAATHDKGIIHRDLKPDNIMIVADPHVEGGARAKILDFGIAKVAAEYSSREGQVRTQTGLIMGTPSYMAPEQCRGASEVDDRADVYSLGIILYELLAGRRPFEAQGAIALMWLHLHEEAPPLHGIAPCVSAELGALVHAMLAKEPAARPSMREVAWGLEQQWAGPGGQELSVPGSRRGERPPAAAPPAEVSQAHAGSLQQVSASLAPAPPRPLARLWGQVSLATGLGCAVALLAVSMQRRAEERRELRVQQAVVDTDADLRAQRWDQAIARIELLLQDPDVSPQQQAGFGFRKQRAQRERSVQQQYQRLIALGDAARSSAAILQAYRQIPDDSVYHSLARDRYQAAFLAFSKDRLRQAEEARAANRCQESRALVGQVLEIEPEYDVARQAQHKPCGVPPATLPTEVEELLDARGPMNSPGAAMRGSASRPRDDQTEGQAKRILAQAQRAYDQGHYPEAISLAMSAGAWDRAWRIVGASACQLKDAGQATTAYRQAEAADRQYILATCEQKGLKYVDGEFR